MYSTVPVGVIVKVARPETDETYLAEKDRWAKLCRMAAPTEKSLRPGEISPTHPKRTRKIKFAEAYRVARHTLHGTASIVKTTLVIGRANDEQVKARLIVCYRCPGRHVVWKAGDIHTCGPMLDL